MRLYYYSSDWPDGWRNLGDYLTVPLLQHFGHTIEPATQGMPVLFAIGSILHKTHYDPYPGSEIVVWGSGANVGDPVRSDGGRLNVRAVRGPLTIEALHLPSNTPQGDPALLFPGRIQLPITDLRDCSLFVNHCGSRFRHPHGFDAALSMMIQEQDALELIARLAGARLVASESLHGCILAHAYGVAWAPCSVGDVTPKWQDWMLYLGLPPLEKFIPQTPWDAQEWWERTGRRGRHRDLRPLLDALPSSV